MKPRHYIALALTLVGVALVVAMLLLWIVVIPLGAVVAMVRWVITTALS